MGDDLRQARGEHLGVEGSLQNAIGRPAGLDDVVQRLPSGPPNLGVGEKTAEMTLRYLLNDEYPKWLDPDANMTLIRMRGHHLTGRAASRRIGGRDP